MQKIAIAIEVVSGDKLIELGNNNIDDILSFYYSRFKLRWEVPLPVWQIIMSNYAEKKKKGAFMRDVYVLGVGQSMFGKRAKLYGC